MTYKILHWKYFSLKQCFIGYSDAAIVACGQIIQSMEFLQRNDVFMLPISALTETNDIINLKRSFCSGLRLFCIIVVTVYIDDLVQDCNISSALPMKILQCFCSGLRLSCIIVVTVYIDDLVQDCNISSALAMKILQSCTKPSVWCPGTTRWYQLWFILDSCLDLKYINCLFILYNKKQV